MVCLVAADAKPDVTLQIITIGMANPPLTFSGWCDVELSDGSIQVTTASATIRSHFTHNPSRRAR